MMDETAYKHDKAAGFGDEFDRKTMLLFNFRSYSARFFQKHCLFCIKLLSC